MKFALPLLEQIETSGLDLSEKARMCCLLAREQVEVGNYEAALGSLGPWWEMGEAPRLEGLDQAAMGELLLCAGTVCGWLGSAKQITGAQKVAQGLLSKSIVVFELLGDTVRAAEAQIELAFCYWREGAYDLARSALHTALAMLPGAENDLRAVALIRLAIVEWSTKALDKSYELLTEAAPLVQLSASHSIKGRFHGQLALTLRNLGEAHQRPEYFDQALVEYAAASYHFEQVGFKLAWARVQMNIGFLLFTLGNYTESHQHLMEGRQLLESLNEHGSVAEIDETRARLLLAEGRTEEAHEVIEGAVRTFKEGGQDALLVEALTTQGVVLARLKHHLEALKTLDRAWRVAERCDDNVAAGKAALTLLEELFEHLREEERRDACSRAVQLLTNSPNELLRERLKRAQERIREAEESEAQRLAAESAALRRQAYYDPLTDLANRARLTEHLREAIAQARREDAYSFAVLYIDLDNTKQINDNFGHSAGDQLFIQVARRLEECIRQKDLAARVGGDEFAIFLHEIGEAGDAIMIAERIQQALAPHFDLGGHETFTTASIGIAMSAPEYETPEQILRDADTAMYQAKKTGVGRYELFDREMHVKKVRRLQLESDLRRAVERQEFHLNYQPIVDIATGRLAGFEALCRWQHAERGFVSPGEFIPVAEDTGAIIQLGQWVLAEACRQVRAWQQLTPAHRQLMISVNLSSKQFTQRDLVGQIERILKETDFDPHALKLEITESTVMENAEVASHKINQLRELGLQLSMDDFGTGYSSLSRLHSYPVTTLKVDRSFVYRIGRADDGDAIVRTIITLAQSLKMDVVAEGVETAEQLEYLARLGCEYAQGYLLSKPLSAADAEELVRRDAQWAPHVIAAPRLPSAAPAEDEQHPERRARRRPLLPVSRIPQRRPQQPGRRVPVAPTRLATRLI